MVRGTPRFPPFDDLGQPLSQQVLKLGTHDEFIRPFLSQKFIQDRLMKGRQRMTTGVVCYSFVSLSDILLTLRKKCAIPGRSRCPTRSGGK